MRKHVHVDVCACTCTCVFSEIVCSALCFHDFVCMHLLLDQFFDDFLKFQKLMQPITGNSSGHAQSFRKIMTTAILAFAQGHDVSADRL